MARTPDPTFLERLDTSRPAYFWWMLALILSLCFTFLSWTLCYTIFNEPEVPRHYEIMKKLDRLPIHTNYASKAKPKLPTSEATTLRNQFLTFSPDEAATINNSMMRSYLTNFNEKTFSSYLKGSFKVLDARALTNEDFITEGFALKLEAYTQLDEYTDPAPYPVIAELIFPTPYSESYKGFHKGDMIKLNITPHFATILHAEKVEREDDDTIVVITAVSLASKIRPPHAGPFDLQPPNEVKLKATMPLW